ncbi:MAG TPA: ABC transporter substrate-binding protein [Acidimicrobiales bacterium]|jgi:branched-chain amino acid transport system substrate-binding protein
MARRRSRRSIIVALATLGCAAGISIPVTSAGAARATITIGFVGDLTGSAASSFADGPGGAQARIDLQNAQGGVNGHKLKLVVVDDQSSPTDEVTAVQDLVSTHHVFGIVSDSAYSFAGVKYEHAEGVPETNVCPCAPTYAEQPYTNTFNYGGFASPTVFNGVTYGTTTTVKFLKDIGVTKLAGFAYGVSPGSTNQIIDLFAEAKKVGGVANCLEDLSVPYGGVDFTAANLEMKSGGCNGLATSFVDSSDVAMSQAVKNAGLDVKQVYFTGYDNDVVSSAADEHAFDGAYVSSPINFSTPNGPVKRMLGTLQKYDHSFTGGIPDYGLSGSYIATDLMIKGLELAGANPTRAAFIKNLRNLSSYDAGGILPTTVSFRNFGTPKMLPKTDCSYFMQLKGKQFVAYGGRPVCGTTIVIPSSASSP